MSSKPTMAIDGFASLLGTSHKIELSDSYDVDYLSTILYLTPWKSIINGIIRNLCSDASEGCAGACLNSSGRGGMRSVQAIRAARTRLFWTNRARFMGFLGADVARHERKARKLRKQSVVRLNGTADIAWETTGILERFPGVIFYDYTKSKKRMKRFLAGEFPPNYSLTFSRSEKNDAECREILALGGNVSMVWRKALPVSHLGHDVIDGTIHDLRFLDPRGAIVGLRALGKAQRDDSGFVLDGSK